MLKKALLQQNNSICLRVLGDIGFASNYSHMILNRRSSFCNYNVEIF